MAERVTSTALRKKLVNDEANGSTPFGGRQLSYVILFAGGRDEGRWGIEGNTIFFLLVLL